MADIKEWFLQIPIITRAWFGLSIALPILGRIGLLNPYHLFMTKDFFYRLEVIDIIIEIISDFQFNMIFDLFFSDMETIHWNILLSYRSWNWIPLSAKSLLSLSIFEKS